jgi:hypothetical protein
MDGATEVGLAWERYDTCTLRYACIAMLNPQCILHIGPKDMNLDEVQYTPTSTPVAQAASPSVPCRLLQTIYNLQRLYARLYMASAASATIYEQGWAFDEASINVDIIGHSTYHKLRHVRAFRSTYLQPSMCSIVICLVPVM